MMSWMHVMLVCVVLLLHTQSASAFLRGWLGAVPLHASITHAPKYTPSAREGSANDRLRQLETLSQLQRLTHLHLHQHLHPHSPPGRGGSLRRLGSAGTEADGDAGAGEAGEDGLDGLDGLEAISSGFELEDVDWRGRSAEEVDAAAEIALIRAELEDEEGEGEEGEAAGSRARGGQGNSSVGTDTAGGGADSTFEQSVSEEEMEAIILQALGPEHAAELSAKVEAAMQEDWDVQQGVNTVTAKKTGPLKANVDLWSYHARQHFIAGNFSGAEALYARCTEYDPTDGRAWLGLARIHWKRSRRDLAEKSYKEGLYSCPRNPYLLQGLAVMLEKMGDVEEAQQLLVRSVKANPRHAASWVALAGINRRKGDLGTARYCLSSAVAGDPHSYVALQAWGSLEAESSEAGSVDKARDLFARALRISTTSVHTLHAWAQLEKRQGRYEASMELLQQALKVKNAEGRRERGERGGRERGGGEEGAQSSTRILMAIAELLQLQGAEDWAVRELFLQGERAAVRFGDAGFFQSWAMHELRTLQQLERDFGLQQQQSMEQQELGGSDARPTDAGAGAGAVSGGGGKSGYLTLKDEPISQTRVTAAAIRQRASSVRRLFKRAVTLNKFHSASWVAWAKFEQKSGHPDVARKLLITGISNFPHSRNIAYFHCALGHLSRQQGDVGTARACYARALAASPPHKSLPVLLEYARMELLHGAAPEARKLLDMAVKRFPGDSKVQAVLLEAQELQKTRESGNGGGYSGGGGRGGGDGGGLSRRSHGGRPGQSVNAYR
ncbi:hypothetical protein B484DRAFT_111004 [Ochromonadaceae sp. CCMP2298]|nr:hypothetical protein B484DRAFT_111004 [Ochromonadaceae sp. CCMP2298]